MLETIIVILILLWLLGFIGPSVSPRIPRSGNLVHILLVIVLILVIVRFLL
jgi:hypothetical protein